MDIPNTVVTEDGQIIFINSFEMTEDDLDDVEEAYEYCKKLQNRYKTSNVYEMMKLGASRTQAMRYIAAQYDLLKWGYLGDNPGTEP